jgi:CheY-like chemotaxis protein
VLLVDDVEDSRDAYSHYLRFSGFHPEVAVDGVDAVERAGTLRPDLIVMDLSLPHMDGWEATRRIKQDERTHNIPVLVLTGYALDPSKKAALAAGCDAYLTKPCEPEALIAEIRRLLASRP